MDTIISLFVGIGFLVLLIWLSGVIDGDWLAAHPEQRRFRWGYFQALCGILSGVCWLYPLFTGQISGLGWPTWIVNGIGYPFASYVLIRSKRRWAWVFMVVAQLNLLGWIINYFYGKNHWDEFTDTKEPNQQPQQQRP